MKALVACEYSGRVRDAFIALGHDAISCDIKPTSIPGPHYQGDIRDILYQDWDMIIAFPPCTHLAVSGAKHFPEKIKDGRQQAGVDFFMLFANHPCPKVVIENPIGIMSTKWRKPNQIIQPWQHGDPYTKSTCLWLKGVTCLRPTNIVSKGRKVLHGSSMIPEWYSNRQLPRDLTFQGIANAMAAQWGADSKSSS
jgi:site-specific DNA-cytosine methylase